MTASELKAKYQQANPDGHFFDRETMRFFGDTMKNYGVSHVIVRHKDTGEEFQALKLYRRKPVKRGLQNWHFFDLNGRELLRVE